MAKNIKVIEFKVEGAEWQKEIDLALDNVVKNITLPGFRKGKAPKSTVMSKHKNDIILDAADVVLQKEYGKVLKDNEGFEIITEPKVDIVKVDEKSAEFKITLTGKPDVVLGKYKDLTVKRETVKVTKTEIDKVISEMKQKFSEIKEKKTALKDGDTAVINFEGFSEGVAFEGGKGEDYSLELGSNTFIPGFEEQIIGSKAGDKLDVNVTFPKEYHSEDLAGKPVVFKVEVLKAMETVIPELGKEFYEDLALPGVEDKESLEKEVKENLKVQKENDAENKYLDELLIEASKTMKVDIPEELIVEEENRMISQYEENLKMQGLTIEQFYQFTNSDEAALREQMKEEASNRVKFRLMLEEIVKVEKIKITEKQAEDEATKLAEKYQMEKEEFLKAFGGTNMIKYDLEMRAAIDILKGTNK